AYLRLYTRLGLSHTFAVAGALMVLMVIAGALLVLNRFEQRAAPRLTAYVVLHSSATAPQATALADELRSWSGVREVTLRDGAANLAMLRRETGHALSGLQASMLPTTVQIAFRAPLDGLTSNRDALMALQERSTVESVEATRAEVTGLLEALGELRWLALALALVVVFVGVMVVAGIQGASVLTRREEIAILRLVGATDRQIVWPLYRESLALSLAGSLVAMIAALSAAWWLRGSPLLGGDPLGLWMAPMVVLIGVLMAWSGTTVCLRRYAHLVEDP
ncbi:MAG: permease-like cell division protein FtsX, partial [Myxococcota bacterium]